MASGSLIVNGNALYMPLADKSVHCVVTSPPYWGLRDYGTAQWQGGNKNCEHTICTDDGDNKAVFEGRVVRGDRSQCLKCGALRVDQQLGLEAVPDCLGWATGTPCGECYVCHTVQWAREVKRVLRDDGTFWLNLGDSYIRSPGKGGSGPKSKNSTKTGYGIAQSSKIGSNDGMVARGDRPGSRAKILGFDSKQMFGIPWRVALALQADGWILRQDIIWAKGVSGQRALEDNAYEAALREGLSAAAARRVAQALEPYVGNCMPESVQDRLTGSHEYLFLFAKRERYYFDHIALQEQAAYDGRKDTVMKGSAKYKNGFVPDQPEQSFHARGHERWQRDENGKHVRNRRSVWTINTQGYEGGHFAVFPPNLVEPCILAGTSARGCCPKCAAPWIRVIEKSAEKADNHKSSRFDRGKTGSRDGGERTQRGERYVTRTISWQPSCECYNWKTCIVCGNERPEGSLDCGHNICDDCLLCGEAGDHENDCEMNPIGCTVLDPFSGTGTVGEVCAQHERRYIGIELNQEYIALQRQRVGSAVNKYKSLRRQESLFGLERA